MQHHAYYIEASLALFDAYKEELKPFWANKFERFGVDEARELIILSSLKNFKDATFFIGAVSLTTEAQQALLKLLEEPQTGTTFVLLIPHGSLLPTLRSRMLEYPHQLADSTVTTENNSLSKQAVAFLKAPGKGRSDIIAKMLKDDEGVKEYVRDFVNALEVELQKKIQNKEVREALQDITKVRDYLGDRSPSLKMLLEHLALALPASPETSSRGGPTI